MTLTGITGSFFDGTIPQSFPNVQPEVERKEEHSYSHSTITIEPAELANIEKDEDFLNAILERIQCRPNKQELKNLLELPTLTARFHCLGNIKRRWNKTSPNSTFTQLALLLTFLNKDCQLTQEPFIQKFLLMQLARIYTFLHIHNIFDQKDYHRFIKENGWLFEKLLSQQKVSPAIEELLHAILSRSGQSTSASIAKVLNPESAGLGIVNKEGYNINMREKILAVEVGDLIDGFQSRIRGIRLTIHKPPKGEEGRGANLIMKTIDEFQSARRNFIFHRIEKAQLLNYKTMMLYVICALKKDRASYYEKNPDYLNADAYEKQTAEWNSTEFFRLYKEEERYRFEWIARQLIALENKVMSAETDDEITLILEQFYDLYRDLPNGNIDLTICSQVSPEVFSLGWHLKPVLQEGVPSCLIDLARCLGILDSVSQYDVLAVFKELPQIPAIVEKLEVFQKELSATHSQRLSYLQTVFKGMSELKTVLFQELLKSKEASISKSLRQIEAFEIAIAEESLKEYSHSTKEVWGLIMKIAVSQGVLKKEVNDPKVLRKALENERKERQRAYTHIRPLLLNSPEHLPKINDIDGIVQTMQGSLNTGIAAVLDKLLQLTLVEVNSQALSGHCTQSADLFGKIRFVFGEDDAPAKAGEILVIQNASPDIHRYAKAAAIISEQGGIFSHAAITFHELNIPALLGCDIDTLKDCEGQWVFLQLSESPSIKLLSKESVNIIERTSELSLENAKAIASLPEGIREVASRKFYKEAFAQLPAKQVLTYPEARKYLVLEQEANQDLQQRFWKAETPLEKASILKRVEKSFTRLSKIAEESDEKLAHNQKFVDFQQKVSQSCVIPPSILGKGGKLENLDKLQTVLSKISSTLKVHIPAYSAFNAQDIVWSHSEEIKKQMMEILHSQRTIAEKSQQIRPLLSQIKWDLSHQNEALEMLKGPLIVRSSSQMEDQANSAAAGIFDSIVVKDRKDLQNAFFEVLASAFSERALTFAQHNVDDLFNMKWIVQEYVSEGLFSGVAFSVANEKDWNIAGMQLVKGLGGGVDGKETPAHVFIDKQDLTLTDLRTQKGQQLPCETPMVKEITRLVKALESHFHTPIEIEFVGDANSLAIVQLRAISSL